MGECPIPRHPIPFHPTPSHRTSLPTSSQTHPVTSNPHLILSQHVSLRPILSNPIPFCLIPSKPHQPHLTSPRLTPRHLHASPTPQPFSCRHCVVMSSASTPNWLEKWLLRAAATLVLPTLPQPNPPHIVPYRPILFRPIPLRPVIYRRVPSRPIPTQSCPIPFYSIRPDRQARRRRASHGDSR